MSSVSDLELDQNMLEILGSLQALGNKDGATENDLAQITPQPAPSSPYAEVTEQPKQRDHRFRYPVEGRQAGSISGEKATSDLPSFPAIRVHNLTGRARVVVSLVTKDEPYKPHPHRLVGDSCRDGVCIMFIDPQHPEAIFRKIGVQRTMNKEVENSLAERKKAGVRLPMEINKGKTGKKHNYDMKAVRLFFEVSLETRDSSGVFEKYLDPVASSPIYDKKDTVLTICRVNINNGTVAGGDELFILCEKVQADDIRVKFTGVDPDTQHIWNAFGIFGPSDVHRQFAIVCRTPRFVNQHIKAAVTVKFQLYRTSDEELSNEMEFTYKPIDENFGQNNIEKKKRKFNHKEAGEFNKFFTSGGQPFKTETLGASAQSCSGAPVSTPVSNAPSTLSLTSDTTTTCDVKQKMRQRLMKKDGSRPSTPSTPTSTVYSMGTAQPSDMNLPVTTTYSTGTVDHMSSGRLIQQHQPVSTDQGPYEFATSSNPYTAMQVLQSMATNMVAPADDERTSSEQGIQAIMADLMAVEAPPAPAATEAMTGTMTANRVVVKPEPSGPFLFDVQFSGLSQMDLDTLTDMTSGETMAYDLVYGDQQLPQHQEEVETMDVNNTSNSSNTNNSNNNMNPHPDTMG